MAIRYGFTAVAVNKRTIALLLPLVGLSLVSGSMVAAPQERAAVTAQEASAPDQTASPEQLTSEITDTPPAEKSHASQQAPEPLMIMAAHQPQKFIGKTLVLVDHANIVRIGPVKDLRRRKQDQQLYLIVDAQAYFNSPVLFAVEVKDIERMEAETLVIPEAPGMHLKGLQYYPNDYNDKL